MPPARNSRRVAWGCLSFILILSGKGDFVTASWFDLHNRGAIVQSADDRTANRFDLLPGGNRDAMFAGRHGPEFRGRESRTRPRHIHLQTAACAQACYTA